ncbi:MAG TPA: hypothetical protein VFP98_06030, partial [Candidatus Polarisedimenticolia bacterium]|nr:hypothetical protein [Candidatus Polarisedimenticolia bacterium]
MKILVGCLAAPFVLLLVAVVLVLAFRAMPMESSEKARAALQQPMEPPPGVSVEQLAAEGLDVAVAIPAGAAVPVHMKLEEGNFTVRPGPAGGGIRVEGDYDKGTFELSQEMTTDSSGKPLYKLSFRPRYSMMRRLLSHGFLRIDDNTNVLTIYLPRGMPMALTARVLKGASRLELGGLALQSANLDLSMGEHEVRVSEPNPIAMDTMELNAGMGEVSLFSLGNLRAGSITVWGKMGEIDVDLGDEVLRDTTLFTKMRMGEMTVGLPRSARVQARTQIFLAEGDDIP